MHIHAGSRVESIATKGDVDDDSGGGSSSSRSSNSVSACERRGLGGGDMSLSMLRQDPL